MEAQMYVETWLKTLDTTANTTIIISVSVGLLSASLLGLHLMTSNTWWCYLIFKYLLYRLFIIIISSNKFIFTRGVY